MRVEKLMVLAFGMAVLGGLPALADDECSSDWDCPAGSECVWQPNDSYCTYAPPPPPATDVVRLMTWNVAFLHPFCIFGWCDDWGDEVDFIIQEMVDHRINIAVFQEVFHNPTADDLRRQLRNRGYFVTEVFWGFCWHWAGCTNDSGLMIASAFPFTRYEDETYAGCTGFDCWATKGAMGVTVTGPNGDFSLINTHLNAGDGALAVQVRHAQLAQLRSFSDLSFTGNVVIAGDMNTEPGIELNLMLAILGTQTTDTSPFTATNPDGQKIDYVMFTPVPPAPVQEFTVDTDVLGHFDHFPVIVQFGQ